MSVRGSHDLLKRSTISVSVRCAARKGREKEEEDKQDESHLQKVRSLSVSILVEVVEEGRCVGEVFSWIGL